MDFQIQFTTVCDSGSKSVVATVLNNYFIDVVENVEREPFPLLDNSTNLSDEIDRIIKKYYMHPKNCYDKE